MDQLGFGLVKDGAKGVASAELLERSRARAAAILADMIPQQRAMAMDPNTLVSACCPRRAGKSYCAVSTALAVGEAKPYSVVLLISLTLKASKRIYWHGSQSGIPFIGQKHGLNLSLNNTELRWEHENGSVGYLMAAETREQAEYMRGSEADLYIIDECKSFSPSILDELINDILMPQRMSRMGRIILIGTPGNAAVGPFYDATGRDKPDADGNLPIRVEYGKPDPWGRPTADLWSYHHWSLPDNYKMAHQYADALATKRRRGWDDDHPTWRREFLGHWVPTSEGLVFSYMEHKSRGAVTWNPSRSSENPTGLPEDRGPWRIVFGLDLGFQDPTALVVVAYSERHQEFRHVWDFKAPHMVVDDVVNLIQETMTRFGKPDMIFADTGGLGKMIVETLRSVHGLDIVAASKSDKNDHIELLNSEFRCGRAKIIPSTDLEDQLLSVAWDLSQDGKEELARLGKLREDKKIPNDLTDAFMYAFRGCYHHFAKAQLNTGPAKGTREYFAEWERSQYEAACREQRLARATGLGRRGPTRSSLSVGSNPPGLPLKISSGRTN